MRSHACDSWAKLRAISIWDQPCSVQKAPDAIDKEAWRARRQRFAEIQEESGARKLDTAPSAEHLLSDNAWSDDPEFGLSLSCSIASTAIHRGRTRRPIPTHITLSKQDALLAEPSPSGFIVTAGNGIA